MGTFSKTSQERLATCHPLLQQVANEAIKTCPVDFGIAEGNRTIERQQQLFKEGKSKIDGITQKGKHNYIPSEAFDIYAYVNGKISYDAATLSFIAGFIISTAIKLNIKLRWGGNWDGDGEIIKDQTLIDLPHFELL